MSRDDLLLQLADVEGRFNASLELVVALKAEFKAQSDELTALQGALPLPATVAIEEETITEEQMRLRYQQEAVAALQSQAADLNLQWTTKANAEIERVTLRFESLLQAQFAQITYRELTPNTTASTQEPFVNDISDFATETLETAKITGKKLADKAAKAASSKTMLVKSKNKNTTAASSAPLCKEALAAKSAAAASAAEAIANK